MANFNSPRRVNLRPLRLASRQKVFFIQTPQWVVFSINRGPQLIPIELILAELYCHNPSHKKALWVAASQVVEKRGILSF